MFGPRAFDCHSDTQLPSEEAFKFQNFEFIVLIVHLVLQRNVKISLFSVNKNLEIIGKTLDKLSASYDNIILLGDFNVEPEEARMTEFLNMYSLKNLVSQKTCFKTPENPSCIDLILTNC